MFELKSKNKVKNIHFFTSDKKTYNDIKKNYVIYDGINKIGYLKYIGRSNKSFFSTVMHRIKYILFFIYIIYLLITNNAYIIHFTLLNHWPWKLLYYFNKKRIILSEKTWMSRREFNFSNIGGRREATKFSPLKPVAGKIIIFNEGSSYLRDKRIKNTPIILQDGTANLKAWVKFIDNNAKKYTENEFKKKLSNTVYCIMLGTFTPLVYLKSKDSVRECLIDTFEALSKIKYNFTVLVKPHVISDPLIYEKIILNYPQLDIRITYLHPAILAKVSNIIISNYYSTTLSIIKAFGVPTLEYTEYSKEALDFTQGTSVRPEFVDYFINRNKKELSETLDKHSQKKEIKHKYILLSESILEAFS
jgi:hypothetical protein